MTVWESLKTFLKREAADVGEGLSSLRDKLDAELTKREQELEASPSERIDIIQGDIEAAEARLDHLEAELDDRDSRESASPDDDG